MIGEGAKYNDLRPDQARYKADPDGGVNQQLTSLLHKYHQ